MLQSNLSIIDILYSRHPVIADTFKENRPNHGQTLTGKHLYSGRVLADNCYSGHNFLAPRKKFKPNLPLYSGCPIFFEEKYKKNCYSNFKWFYLTHFSTFLVLLSRFSI